LVDETVAARAVDETRVTTKPLPERLSRRVEDLVGGADHASLLRMLTADLAEYQDVAYARRFLDLVETAAAAERRVDAPAGAFTVAVARNYHKLLAYKDEYEVARLMVGEDGLAAARAVSGGDAGITWHLHPPAFRAAGVRRKTPFGEWSRPMFVALAAGKRLRGTRLDPFGRAEVRRLERELPVEYASAVEEIARRLTADNVDAAVEIASLPDMVRGYETLKLRRAEAYRTALTVRLADL
jgi:indolepyruvate ferredoxin oxidoreductase